MISSCIRFTILNSPEGMIEVTMDTFLKKLPDEGSLVEICPSVFLPVTGIDFSFDSQEFGSNIIILANLDWVTELGVFLTSASDDDSFEIEDSFLVRYSWQDFKQALVNAGYVLNMSSFGFLTEADLLTEVGEEWEECTHPSLAPFQSSVSSGSSVESSLKTDRLTPTVPMGTDTGDLVGDDDTWTDEPNIPSSPNTPFF